MKPGCFLLTLCLQRALGLYARVREARQAMRRLRGVLKQPPVFGKLVSPASDLTATLNLQGVGLRLDDGPWLARHIDLQAERGQTIAVRPATDAVGSALLQVCAGLRPTAEGIIRLNGIDPTQLTSAELIRHVGYLPPQPTIYRGTLYDNLSRFGLTPKKQVAEMIELLELEPILSVLPRGFNTLLENILADPLPPGIKQRLCLARVLAMKPRVILFHQADRALDSAGYNAVYRLMARLRGKVLMLLLTDDRNLLALADQQLIQQGNTFKFQMPGSATPAKQTPLYIAGGLA